MIDDRMEYLQTKDEKEYYFLEEVGFTHKKYALQHNLYEFFGKSQQSTFQEIFRKNAFTDNLMMQVWVFKEDKPIGLAIAIESRNFKPIIYEGKKRGDILGAFHFYVDSEHRKQGIGKELMILLEKKFHSHEKGFVILQDDALWLKSHMSHHIALPPDHVETIKKQFSSNNPDANKLKC